MVAVRALNADAPLSIDTYDGGDHLKHPSVVDAGVSGWNGYRWWMAATPYPDSVIENPSIWASNDKTTWVVPAGVTNPLIAKPSGGFNSDTHLVLDGSTMHLVYREVTSNDEKLYVISATDPTSWSAPTEIHSVDKTVRRVISPAIVKEDDDTWTMWAIDEVPSVLVVKRYTAAAIDGTFTLVDTCQLPPPPGLRLWHIDVQRHDGKYFMLINCNDAGDGWDGVLYWATSTDGRTWNRRLRQILGKRGTKWDISLYRSCWLPNDDGGWDIWYSGSNSDGSLGANWEVGYTSVAELPT